MHSSGVPVGYCIKTWMHQSHHRHAGPACAGFIHQRARDFAVSFGLSAPPIPPAMAHQAVRNGMYPRQIRLPEETKNDSANPQLLALTGTNSDSEYELLIKDIEKAKRRAQFITRTFESKSAPSASLSHSVGAAQQPSGSTQQPSGSAQQPSGPTLPSAPSAAAAAKDDDVDMEVTPII